MYLIVLNNTKLSKHYTCKYSGSDNGSNINVNCGSNSSYCCE